ncbi:hypothetical protein ACM40_17565 [Chryseobacterium sp. BLS98]|nr:hypothetical protein ACM40_17565 [Chryseobacterium sp. BLS98]
MKKFYAVQPDKIRFFSLLHYRQTPCQKAEINNKYHKKTELINNPVFLLNIKICFLNVKAYYLNL